MPWWFWLSLAGGLYVTGYFPSALIISHLAVQDATRRGRIRDDYDRRSEGRKAADLGMQVAFIWPLTAVFGLPVLGLRKFHARLIRIAITEKS